VPYTLGQAAKATGLSKPTISEAIKKGRISARKNESGQL
jgi:excisionase family DNA binding protein